MPSQSPDTRTEIEAGIATHGKYQSGDFKTAHFKFWTALVCSFAATLGSAAHIGLEFPVWGRILLAIGAAIPGVIILTEKTFNHATRAAWHAEYAIRLRGFRRRLDHDPSLAPAIAEELTKLDLEMHHRFPHTALPTLPFI